MAPEREKQQTAKATSSSVQPAGGYPTGRGLGADARNSLAIIEPKKAMKNSTEKTPTLASVVAAAAAHSPCPPGPQ